MANPLAPDTLASIQKAAGQISVAQQLDPEIQAELQSHMEEKVLAYLTGQEKITEVDALLLTRVHFGDPEIIGALFGRVDGRKSRQFRHARLTGLSGVLLLVIAFGLYRVGAFIPLPAVSQSELAAWCSRMKLPATYVATWCSHTALPTTDRPWMLLPSGACVAFALLLFARAFRQSRLWGWIA